MMKKNIVILEDSSQNKMGGGQVITLEITETLAKAFDVYLCDSSKNKYFHDLISPFIKAKFSLTYFKPKMSDGKLGKLLDTGIFVVLLFVNLFRVKAAFSRRGLRSANTTLLATTKKNLVLAYLMHKFFGFSYVYYAHILHERTGMMGKIYHKALQSSLCIICVSQTVLDHIKLKHCVLIYNYAPPLQVQQSELKMPQGGEQPFIAATFSSLIKIKGIDHFMKSHNLLKNGPDITYWIFGAGTEQDHLSSLEQEQVVLKGFTPSVEKVLREKVSLIVLPTVIEEACPTIILQAFSCGIPVVTTNIGGQNELVSKNGCGLVVDTANPQQLANAIDILFSNRELYEDFQRKAKEASKAYSIEHYRNEVMKLFNDLADTKKNLN